MFKIKSPKEKYKTGVALTRNSEKDQVPQRNEHHLLIGHIRLVLFVVIEETKNSVENKVINYYLTISIKKVLMRPNVRLYLLTKSLFRPWNLRKDDFSRDC